MNDQINEDFFYGVLVLNDGKWTPKAKFDSKGLGGALTKAEELDTVDTDGVKIMKIPTKGSRTQQEEVWLSPRFKAKSEALAAANLRSGIKQTTKNLAAAHARRVAEFKSSS